MSRLMSFRDLIQISDKYPQTFYMEVSGRSKGWGGGGGGGSYSG